MPIRLLKELSQGLCQNPNPGRATATFHKKRVCKDICPVTACLTLD